jgi:predicted small lipoprotein YifL
VEIAFSTIVEFSRGCYGEICSVSDCREGERSVRNRYYRFTGLVALCLLSVAGCGKSSPVIPPNHAKLTVKLASDNDARSHDIIVNGKKVGEAVRGEAVVVSFAPQPSGSNTLLIGSQSTNFAATSGAEVEATYCYIHRSFRANTVEFSVRTTKEGEDLLQFAIGHFEAQRKAAHTHTASLDVKYASSEPPTVISSLGTFAEEWGKEWGKVREEVAELKQVFAVVQRAGDEHFHKLDTLAKSIASENLRDGELKKIAGQQQRWKKALTEASANMARMEQQIQFAQDIYTVMKLTVLRSAVEEKIADIRKVSREIKAVVTELEKLTAEGRSLVR